MKNALGVPLKVLPSSNFRIVGSVEKENINYVQIGQNMELEYSVFEAPQRGKLSALHRQESSVFSLNLGIVLGKRCVLGHVEKGRTGVLVWLNSM